MIMERLEFMAEHQLDERHLHMASDHVADISPELGSTRERMTEWKEMGDFVAGGHHHESTDEEVSEPESDEEEL